MDGASNAGYFLVELAINGKVNTDNGLAAIDGNGGSTNYRTLSVSGFLKLNRGQHVSVYVYSQKDTSYTVNVESGFSCHRLPNTVGFHVDKNGDQANTKGWTPVTK